MKTNRKAGGVLISMIGVFISLSFLTSFSDAAIPQKMNYQGYLTSAAGVPVNGTVQMVFSIYNVPSGGTELWTETQNVAVTHGVYNVEFGEVTPVNLAFDVQYYLGIKVGTDPEMTPRIPLTSVGYAFRAQTVEMIGSHTHSGTDITSGTVSEPRIDSAIARTLALNAHTSNMNNPHATTATQVGAAPSVHSHSGGDITAGIVAEARIDPLIARDSEVSSSISTHTANASAHHTRYTNAEAVAAVKAADGSGSGLDADLLDGLHASALASSTHNHDAAYVNVTGDTMTGALNLPANGLAVGTNQLVVSGGRVGVGTAGPNEQLEITGNLRIPMTTASGGMIKAGADRFIHNSGGTSNLFAGVNAGNLSMTGLTNTGIGYLAISSDTTGERNTGVGATALMNNTAGKDNTAVGMNALTMNTTAGGNVAVGTAALYAQSYNNGGTAWATNNTAVGYYALNQNNPASTSTGFHNSAFGASALFLNTTGYYNTASGSEALYSNTTGNSNTASGFDALHSNTMGSYNTASGYDALGSNTTGSDNTAIGSNALDYNTTGYSNTASGSLALYYNTTGNSNTASGSWALSHNTTGYSNTASGAAALYSNTTGTYNTASGAAALYFNKTGSSNTASGAEALRSNTTGSYNTASGYEAGYLNTGSENTFLGYNAGYSNEIGNWNTFLGSNAGYLNTGFANVFIGSKAGYNETGSDKLYIDNSDTSAPLIYGDFSANSVKINGTFTATGTKSFIQPHAKDPTKEIVYIATEAPEAVVMYRGTAQLKEGVAIIELPEHFRVVAAEEGVQVQVTPAEDCNGIFVQKKSRERIEIKELMKGKSNAKFDYLITAVRAGYEDHKPVVANTNFRPKGNEKVKDFEARYFGEDMNTRAMRAMLISNGILTQDGELSMEVVKSLGWIVKEAEVASVRK